MAGKRTRQRKKTHSPQKLLVIEEGNTASVVNTLSSPKNLAVQWNIRNVLALLVGIAFIAFLLLFVISYGVQKGLTGYVIAENPAGESVVVQTERHLSAEEIVIIINISKQDIEEMKANSFSTYYVTDLFLVMEDESNDNIIDYTMIVENAQLIKQAKEDAFYSKGLL